MKKALFSLITLSALSQASFADELKFHVYNPQEKSIFPVTSTIVEGENEVLLLDAQFQRNDAQALITQIKALNKPLTTIFISHGDPDYYFGLDVIAEAFPEAKILTTPETLAHIKKTVIAKIDYWSPLLKEQAPKAIVLPQATEATSLAIGAHQLEIKGQKIDPNHRYLWDAESKTLLGGVRLYQGMHLWLADTQTAQSRKLWADQLTEMQALQPKTVIAGHYLGESSAQAISFDQNYLANLEKALPKAKNSQALIKAMDKIYPNLAGKEDLKLGAEVLKNEVKW